MGVLTSHPELISGTLKEMLLEGEDCFNNGELEDAVSIFNEILSVKPDDVQAISNLGVAYWQIGENKRALACLERATQIEPDNRVAVFNLVCMHESLGLYDKAIELCDSYTAAHPDDSEMVRLKHHIAELSDQTDMENDDELANDIIRKAQMWSMEGDTGRAIHLFQAVLSLNTSNPVLQSVYRNLAVSFRKTGNTHKQTESLLELFRLDSNDKNTVLELTEVMMSTGQLEPLAHILATFLLYHPDDEEVRKLVEQLEAEATRPASVKCHEQSVGGELQETSPEKIPVKRIPEINESLTLLKTAEVDIKAILDIGILYGTPPLMKQFPDLKHYLFEPVDDHFGKIRHNYSNIEHELFHVALSDTDGEAWQNSYCIDGSDRITHSHLGNEQLYPENTPGLIASKRIRKTTLDSIVGTLDVATPYLLKIDVDGHEIPILEGADTTLQGASVVIIEATANTLAERAEIIARHGFVLYDIVDFCYYSGILHQVDLVFIRKDILENNKILRPLGKTGFNHENWYALSAMCLGGS